jgi:hypothetical protein
MKISYPKGKTGGMRHMKNKRERAKEEIINQCILGLIKAGDAAKRLNLSVRKAVDLDLPLSYKTSRKVDNGGVFRRLSSK